MLTKLIDIIISPGFIGNIVYFTLPLIDSALSFFEFSFSFDISSITFLKLSLSLVISIIFFSKLSFSFKK